MAVAKKTRYRPSLLFSVSYDLRNFRTVEARVVWPQSQKKTKLSRPGHGRQFAVSRKMPMMPINVDEGWGRRQFDSIFEIVSGYLGHKMGWRWIWIWIVALSSIFFGGIVSLRYSPNAINIRRQVFLAIFLCVVRLVLSISIRGLMAPKNNSIQCIFLRSAYETSWSTMNNNKQNIWCDWIVLLVDGGWVKHEFIL